MRQCSDTGARATACATLPLVDEPRERLPGVSSGRNRKSEGSSGLSFLSLNLEKAKTSRAGSLAACFCHAGPVLLVAKPSSARARTGSEERSSTLSSKEAEATTVQDIAPHETNNRLNVET